MTRTKPSASTVLTSQLLNFSTSIAFLVAFLALPCSALLCTSTRFHSGMTVLVDEESVASEGLTVSEIFATHFGDKAKKMFRFL